jgi:two-component system sensor histidine kinase CpxA
VAKLLSPKNGESFVVVGIRTFGPPPGPLPEGKKPPFFARFLPPFFGRGEIFRTVIMLFLISVVCYFLARSLATPIRKLQNITRQIAGGDYSARIGGSLGKTDNEIADLGRDFDIMVDRTEKVINSQKRLLRDISHELRSPLARLYKITSYPLFFKRIAKSNSLFKCGTAGSFLQNYQPTLSATGMCPELN